MITFRCARKRVVHCCANEASHFRPNSLGRSKEKHTRITHNNRNSCSYRNHLRMIAAWACATFEDFHKWLCTFFTKPHQSRWSTNCSLQSNVLCSVVLSLSLSGHQILCIEAGVMNRQDHETEQGSGGGATKEQEKVRMGWTLTMK